MAKYSEKQYQYARKWDAANLDRFNIALPKGYKDRIKRAAGEGSMNAFVKRAIEAALNAVEEQENRQR